MRWFLKPGAQKGLAALPLTIQDRIMKKLEFYIGSGDPLCFAKRMPYSSFGEYRFRIGDYRVLFDVNDQGISILAIGHRKYIYR